MQALIDHLNEILKHEWTGVAQYSQAGFIVEGIWREVFADKFLDDAKESFGHAKLVGNKIVALGGVPTATRNEVKQSRDLQEVLTFSLAFETKAVEMYSAAIKLAEEAGDAPHHLVEAGDRAERVERGAVGGVLPGEGADLLETDGGHAGLGDGGRRGGADGTGPLTGGAGGGVARADVSRGRR